jgi:hypothetical protein
MRARTSVPAIVVACGLLTACVLARAEPAGRPQALPPDSLAAFERDNPDCAEYTNGCQMCKRTGAEVACSNVPIACVQSGRWSCTRELKQDAPKPARP